LSADGRLAENILLFCRTLRAAGVPVGTAQVIDALNAVAAVGVRRRDDFRTSLRASLLNDPGYFRLFDQAFHIYFRNPRLLERALSLLLTQPDDRADPDDTAARRLAEAMTPPEVREDVDGTADAADARPGSHSEIERLRDKDFEEMSLAEQHEAARLLRADLAPLSRIRSRRYRQHAHGSRPDLRRTIRDMLRNDGEPVAIARKRRRLRPPPVVLVCDISGSMSHYSRMFLQFAHVLTARAAPVHTFVFGTRLTNVSRRLRLADSDAALAGIARDVRDWDGGTRIADSLRRFNRDWSRRVLAQGAVLILLSDGLERDTESDLEFQISRLHRSCRRLIWLNPMLRYAEFEPKAFGIRTMLPHVDEFRPAHNLRSLGDLGRLLAADGRAGSAA
jgi:uncharacterized protein with von Willebrand factor type A (vWA) domain